eukprot:scaffold152805_cov35-Tisochrysis_lutea.AAC.3
MRRTSSLPRMSSGGSRQARAHVTFASSSGVKSWRRMMADRISMVYMALRSAKGNMPRTAKLRRRLLRSHAMRPCGFSKTTRARASIICTIRRRKRGEQGMLAAPAPPLFRAFAHLCAKIGIMTLAQSGGAEHWEGSRQVGACK